jgi:hypothetical protein
MKAVNTPSFALKAREEGSQMWNVWLQHTTNDGALKTRTESSARVFNAGNQAGASFQTLHVWLPSPGRFAAKTSISSWRNNGPDCRRDAERNCER